MSKPLVRKRYRVVIEYDVELVELVAERLAAEYQKAFAERTIHWAYAEVRSLPEPEQLEAMRALQHALVASPEALEAFMRYEVATDLDAQGIQGCEQPPERDELLRDIIETLPARYRGRMREAMARDSFWETAPEFLEAARCDIARVYIEP